MRVDETFDCNDDYIEKISVMSRDRMAVAFSSGKIVIREVKKTGRNTCSCLDKLAIPCPESLKEELDQEFDEVDTDGPSLCSSPNGEKIETYCRDHTGAKINFLSRNYQKFDV